MQQVKTIKVLLDRLNDSRREGAVIGFVPTMGALHEGHLALVERCVRENDVCVVSIFVNPTQFNNKNDLVKYPRTLEKDCVLLQEKNCHIVFIPDEKEMYPEEDTRQFDFKMLDKVMEGKFRPGHFNGVAQIVSRLFDIVKPDRAYFGEKDFQQLAIIREMAQMLNLPVDIISCPIVREPDGLAMSSRNTRLTPHQREIAPLIFRALSESRNQMDSKTVGELKKQVTKIIDEEEELETEYFEIVDGRTLQPVHSWDETDFVVGCIAVFCGDVRLIDNIVYLPVR